MVNHQDQPSEEKEENDEAITGSPKNQSIVDVALFRKEVLR